jgi:hypothetical protein
MTNPTAILALNKPCKRHQNGLTTYRSVKKDATRRRAPRPMITDRAMRAGHIPGVGHRHPMRASTRKLRALADRLDAPYSPPRFSPSTTPTPPTT